jgi:hypothetical protein
MAASTTLMHRGTGPILYHAIFHAISIITSMLYIPCHISHVKPFISCPTTTYQISHASWHVIACLLPHDTSTITNMLYMSCQIIYVMPYYPMPYLTYQLSCHLHHGISIIANMLYLPCHISHVISYMSCHILPCYFSHDLYHIIYLLFRIFCDTYLVPYVPVLFLRYCLSCAITCYAIYHAMHRWCHICGMVPYMPALLLI